MILQREHSFNLEESCWACFSWLGYLRGCRDPARNRGIPWDIAVLWSSCQDSRCKRYALLLITMDLHWMVIRWNSPCHGTCILEARIPVDCNSTLLHERMANLKVDKYFRCYKWNRSRIRLNISCLSAVQTPCNDTESIICKIKLQDPRYQLSFEV